MEEKELLSLLKVQSNLSPRDFETIFGEDRSGRLFQVFAGSSWNLVSFMFNTINGEDRQKFLDYVNNEIKNQ